MALAVIHFTYEAIILPSIRIYIKYKLFELRDKLRLLKFANSNSLGDELYHNLQDSINVAIRFNHVSTLHTMLIAKKAIETDPGLRARIEKRMDLIANSSNEEVFAIWHKTMIFVASGTIANNGVWLIYIFPILLLILSYKKCYDFIKQIVSVPNSEIDKVLPHDEAIQLAV